MPTVHMGPTGGARTAPPPHRLTLTAGEYAFLVSSAGTAMPPDWRPDLNARSGAEEAALARRGLLVGDGDLLAVHPSVGVNLDILSRPQLMLDTVASIGERGSHSLHALGGQLGASLFALDDGGVELSLFASVDLGRELVRAVPEGPSVTSILDGGADAQPTGTLPADALRELGLARLMRESDPQAPEAVLARLHLPQPQATLAARVAARTDGALRCLVTGHAGGRIASGLITWLHTDAGWLGLRPEPDGSDRQLVTLEPAGREDLGVWVSPYVAEVLS